MKTDINIITVNNRIYFDGETIAEIRELSDNSDYSTYKLILDQYETNINDGGFHNLSSVLQNIEFLCISYEGEKSANELPDDDNNELTVYDLELLNEIRKLPEDSIFRKELEEAESNNDIRKMMDLANIYELVKIGVFTFEQAETVMKKKTKFNIGHSNASDTLKAYTEAQDNQDDNEVTNMR